MPYEPRAIANFILDLADVRDRPVTIMTLLKVIYFAHGWYYVKHDAPLITGRFEAWKNGPVVRSIWDNFKGAGDEPIRTRAMQFDPVNRTEAIVPYDICRCDREFIEVIFGAYGHLHAFALSDMTHEPGSPWHRVWNAPPGTVYLGLEIPERLIRDHFRTVPAGRRPN